MVTPLISGFVRLLQNLCENKPVRDRFIMIHSHTIQRNKQTHSDYSCCWPIHHVQPRTLPKKSAKKHPKTGAICSPSAVVNLSPSIQTRCRAGDTSGTWPFTSGTCTRLSRCAVASGLARQGRGATSRVKQRAPRPVPNRSFLLDNSDANCNWKIVFKCL